MQAPSSFALVGTVVGIVALAIALGVIIGAPILAVPFVLVGMGAFLVWRGKRRADTPRSSYGTARGQVPSTEETAADPARDGGVAGATAIGSTHRHRSDAPRV
jgi:hypothetical protein